MRFLYVLFFLFLLGFIGCQKVDLTTITTKIDELSARVEKIEKAIEPLLTPDTTKTSITPELKMELDKIKKEITSLKDVLKELESKYEGHVKKYHSGIVK